MRYLFVGEQPSDLAKKMGVSWKDGRLAAKQLFDALDHCQIDSSTQSFVNLFKGKYINRQVLLQISESDVPVVGMGRKVQRVLAGHGIEHIPMVHPAARGKIRRKDRYCEHVQHALEGAKCQQL